MKDRLTTLESGVVVSKVINVKNAGSGLEMKACLSKLSSCGGFQLDNKPPPSINQFHTATSSLSNLLV